MRTARRPTDPLDARRWDFSGVLGHLRAAILELRAVEVIDHDQLVDAIAHSRLLCAEFWRLLRSVAPRDRPGDWSALTEDWIERQQRQLDEKLRS